MDTIYKDNINICVVDGSFLNSGDLSWDPLRQLGNVEIYENTEPEQVISRTYNSDIVITNKVIFDADILHQLHRLRCIIITATGYNNVDIQTANSLGITVCNAPNYSPPSVAQHTFALILHVYNNVSPYSKDTIQGKWNQSKGFCNITYPTLELNKKTIGIVGFGNIGSKVAKIAHAFDMNIAVLTSKDEAILPKYVKKVDKDVLLKDSDILTMHIPLTAETKNFINKNTLGLMKKNSVIVNTARGNLIDEQAVAEALRTKKILAYVADVLSQEPPSADNPLFKVPNAYITPHIAWATKESRQRLLDLTVNNVKSFLNGTPTNIIS